MKKVKLIGCVRALHREGISCISEKSALEILGNNCGKTLKYLCLSNMYINTAILANLSIKFPNVQYLRIEECHWKGKMNIQDVLLYKFSHLCAVRVVGDRSLSLLSYNKSFVTSIAFLLNSVSLSIVNIESFENLQEMVCNWYNHENIDVFQRFMVSISKLNKLETFVFRGTQPLTRAIYEAIAKLPRLKVLKIWSIRTDNTIKNVADILSPALLKLETLFLRGVVYELNMVADFIQKCPKLKYLYLTRFDIIRRIFWDEKSAERLIKIRKQAISDSSELEMPQLLTIYSNNGFIKENFTLTPRKMWSIWGNNKYIKLDFFSKADQDPDFIIDRLCFKYVEFKNK